MDAQTKIFLLDGRGCEVTAANFVVDEFSDDGAAW